MLKQRMHAAEKVTADFLAVERATDQAAALASACVLTMLRERASANLPIGTGLEALELVSDAANQLVTARRRLVDAHRTLVGVRADIGLNFMYGDTSDCPDMETTGLSTVRPNLAAVA